MKSEKNLKFFSSIFFVQEIPLDIKKFQLEVFLENLYTVNAPYLYVLEFKPSAPFFSPVTWMLWLA